MIIFKRLQIYLIKKLMKFDSECDIIQTVFAIEGRKDKKTANFTKSGWRFAGSYGKQGKSFYN